LASPILVTGGTGRLGRLVVQRLREAGSSVRVLARQGRDVAAGVEFVRSDLRLGSGLDAAVAGTSVIVHCATSTKGDVEAMQNLVGAANQTGLPHLVYVSIVGIDAIASWGYPKSKLQAEAVLVNSELPWTILRATQFHEYVLAGLQKLVRSPVVLVPAGFRVQPVDTAAVARRLVELAWRHRRAECRSWPARTSPTGSRCSATTFESAAATDWWCLCASPAPAWSEQAACYPHPDTPSPDGAGSSSSPARLNDNPIPKIATDACRSAGTPPR
jgi:hypothetical protein